MNDKNSILFIIRSLTGIVHRQINNKVLADNSNHITGKQGYIIGYLSDNKDRDIYQRDIENHLQIRRSTATGILQLMEKNGLIERQPVTTDARLKKLVLTQKSIEHHKEIMAFFEELEKKAMQNISEDEIEAFQKTAAKIKQNLK